MTLDGLADLLGAGRPDEDDGVTRLPLLQRDGPRSHVKEGVRTDHGPTRLEERSRQRAQDVGPVRKHGTLGRPRGPARVEHDVRVVLGKDRFDVPRRLPGAEPGQVPKRDHLETELLPQRRPFLGPNIVDHEDAGSDVGKHRRGLVGTPLPVQGHEESSQLGQGGKYRNALERRVAPQRHRGLDADTARAKGSGRAVGVGIELGERERLVAQGCRQPVGRGASSPPEHVPDEQLPGHASASSRAEGPLTPCAVRSRILD